MAKLSSGDGRWFIRPTSLPTLNFRQFRPHIHFSLANEYSNYGSKVHHIDIDTLGPRNKKSKKMGEIEWHKDTGEILRVNVDKPYRRLGVANTLFHEAKSIARDQGLVSPVHSEDRSEMGDKWAKSTGDRVPKLWRKSEEKS